MSGNVVDATFKEANAMRGLAIFLLIFGALFIGLYFEDQRLRAGALAEPQDLTCAELADRGPGDNSYVRLSECIPSLGDFVVEEVEGSQTYRKIWLPLFPLEGDYGRQLGELIEAEERGDIPEDPEATRIRIILESTSCCPMRR